MPSAILYFKYCGKKYKTTKDHILNGNNYYHCNNCDHDLEINFFDCCPRCHENVGFYENKALELSNSDFIFHIGKTMVNSFINPVEGAKYSFDMFSSKESNGVGICPVCNICYVRCPICNNLTSTPPDFQFDSVIKCSSCGKTMIPHDVHENGGNKHSDEFYKH